MYKVLVYLKESELAPVGGQLGYNYNLYKGLETVESKEIAVEYLPGNTVRKGVNTLVKQIKYKSIKKIVSCLKSIYAKGMVLYWGSHRSEVDLSSYNAVHFHSTYDLYKVRNSLTDYKGKIILTTHTPTKPAKEIYDALSRFEKTFLRGFYKKLDAIDDYAFARADYFIFPCEEAEEPYYNNWKNYKRIKDKKKNRYYYNPTGIIEKSAPISREDIRMQWGIPNEAKVVCYIGRHNEIKGYGDLKEIGKKVLRSNEGVYFLLGGREEPMKGLKHERWLEIGWTNDPGSIIHAADIFILPNRETYFDLVLLEVLSLGQIVLATKTGGNRYFEKIKSSGIILYNSIDEGYERIQELLAMPEDQISILRESNRKLFKEQFGVKMFAERYLNILMTLLDL